MCRTNVFFNSGSGKKLPDTAFVPYFCRYIFTPSRRPCNCFASSCPLARFLGMGMWIVDVYVNVQKQWVPGQPVGEAELVSGVYPGVGAAQSLNGAGAAGLHSCHIVHLAHVTSATVTEKG